MFEQEEQRDELLEKIEDLICTENAMPSCATFCCPWRPQDIARSVRWNWTTRLPMMFRLLPKEQAAEVFVELDSDEQEMLIRSFSNTELKEVLDELYLDDTVDIVEEMPANVVKRILQPLRPGHPQEHQRNSEIPRRLRRQHHDHGVRGFEGHHDRGGRPEAHPPHRPGQGDHQHLLCH